MAIYLQNLSSMTHFPFNHVKELELGLNFAKQQVKAWGQIFFHSDLKCTAIHSLNSEEQ